MNFLIPKFIKMIVKHINTLRILHHINNVTIFTKKFLINICKKLKKLKK